MHFRQAGFSKNGWAVLSAGVTLFLGSLGAAPPETKAPPVPAKSSPKAPEPVRVAPPKPKSTASSNPVESQPAPRVSPSRETPAFSSKEAIPQYADAWPSEYRPIPADLQLKPDETRKAEAFAAFSQGLLAEDNSDQEGMLAGYRRALELDPSHAELAVKVAYELARRNDVAAGIQVLKDTVKAAPKEPLPYIYLSQLYANYLKKPELGLTYAEQALSLAPGNFKAYLALLEIYESTGQTKNSEAVLERAAKSDSKDPQFWVDLGDFYQKLYLKPDGSCTPEQLQRMNGVYEKIVALAPDQPALLSKVADYYVLSKQVNAAIPHYLSVLRLAAGPNDPAAANVREKLARSLIVTGQRDEAIAVFEQLVRDHPQRFETREVLGELYRQAGDLDKAIENFRFGLPLDVDEPRNHLRLADLLVDSKKFDEAIATLKDARKKFPDLPYVTWGIALAFVKAERHAEAVTTFGEAEKEAEDRSEEMLDHRFYFQYGAAAEQAAQYEKAAELLKRCIELEPGMADAYNFLGYMWVDRSERLEEAGALIKKALEIEPDNGSYIDSLGWYYFKMGDTERALQELLRAQHNISLQLSPEEPGLAEVLDHIGDAYAKLGKTADACASWQKALGLKQENPKITARIAEKLEAAKQKVTSAVAAPEPAKN